MATNSTLGSQMTLVEDHSRNNLENLTELQNSINAQKMNPNDDNETDAIVDDLLSDPDQPAQFKALTHKVIHTLQISDAPKEEGLLNTSMQVDVHAVL